MEFVLREDVPHRRTNAKYYTRYNNPRGAGCFVPLRGEVKLKLETATKRRQNIERFGNGKRQQQQQREGLPTVFQVDTVLGPGDDTSEARSTIPQTLPPR